MTTLEQKVRQVWREWARYQQFGICAGCGTWRYVGARRLRGRWLCVDCFDQEPRR